MASDEQANSIEVFRISNWNSKITLLNSASLHCAELSAAAEDITGYIFPQFSVKDGSCQAERGLSFLISYYFSVSNVLINMLVGQFLTVDHFLKSLKSHLARNLSQAVVTS